MKIEIIESKIIPVSQIHPNDGQIEGLPKNPRFIKDQRFKKLKKSIKDDPEMLGARELLVYPLDDVYIIIGGNMRYRAAVDLGYSELPCKILPPDTSAEQLRAITIKDNVPYGEHDWELLANEWDSEELISWGLDLPEFDKNAEQEKDEIYTTKIESPIYEPKEEKPEEEDLYNLDKYNQLLEKIKKAKISASERLFLQLAATRHIEFNYRKIADYYAHSDKSVQELIEDSALVIIDYDKAVEDGFVRLFQDLEKLSDLDD